MATELFDFILLLLAEGWTVRQIRQQVLDQHGPEKTPSEMKLLAIAAENASVIGKLREDLAVDLTSRGLALKEVRLAHLTRIYEAWSTRAIAEPKAAGVALSALKQIKEEVDHFNISIVLGRSDPWVQILSQIRDLAEAQALQKAQAPMLSESSSTSSE